MLVLKFAAPLEVAQTTAVPFDERICPAAPVLPPATKAVTDRLAMFAVLTEMELAFIVLIVDSFTSPLAYRTISEPLVFDALIVRSEVLFEDCIVDTLSVDISMSP